MSHEILPAGSPQKILIDFAMSKYLHDTNKTV